MRQRYMLPHTGLSIVSDTLKYQLNKDLKELQKELAKELEEIKFDRLALIRLDDDGG
jgi:hypothetical protein